MLPPYSCERLCNSTVSVRLSVCPINRKQQWHAAGLPQLGIGWQISIDVGAMYQLVTDVCRCQHHVESQGMIHASDLAPWLTITGNINAFIVLYCMKLNTDLLLLYPHITTTDHYQPPQLKINYLFVHECITGPLDKHFPHYHYQYQQVLDYKVSKQTFEDC